MRRFGGGKKSNKGLEKGRRQSGPVDRQGQSREGRERSQKLERDKRQRELGWWVVLLSGTHQAAAAGHGISPC